MQDGSGRGMLYLVRTLASLDPNFVQAEHLLYHETHFHIESAKDLIHLKRMMDETTAKAVIKTLHIDRILINKTRMKELKALSNLSNVFVTWVATSTFSSNYQVLKHFPHDPFTPDVLQQLIQHQENLPYRVLLEIGYTDCTGNAKNVHVKMTSSLNFEIEHMAGLGCRHKEYIYGGVEEGQIMLQWTSLTEHGKQGKIALSRMP